MDRIFEYRGNTFVWDEAKAAENVEDHGVSFEEAAIGFSATSRLLTVVHLEVDGEFIRIISAWRATAAEETIYAQ